MRARGTIDWTGETVYAALANRKPVTRASAKCRRSMFGWRRLGGARHRFWEGTRVNVVGPRAAEGHMRAPGVEALERFLQRIAHPACVRAFERYRCHDFARDAVSAVGYYRKRVP